VNALKGEVGAIRDSRARIEAALAEDRARIAALTETRDAWRPERRQLGAEARVSRSAAAERDRLKTAVEEARAQLGGLRAGERAVQDNRPIRWPSCACGLRC